MSFPTLNNPIWAIFYQNVPLDNTYQKSIDFDSKEKQILFFEDYLFRQSFDYTFIKNNEVNVSLSYHEAIKINYLSFERQNIEASPKIYYAFITDVIYVNDKVSKLVYEIDYFQTYMFDYTLGESFIDRKHQARAKISWESVDRVFNDVPEDLDLGKTYNKLSDFNFTKATGNVPLDNLVLVIAKKPLGITSKEDSEMGAIDSCIFYSSKQKTPFYVYIGWSGIETTYFRATSIYKDNRVLNEVNEVFPITSDKINNPNIVSIIPIKTLPFRLVGDGTFGDPFRISSSYEDDVELVLEKTLATAMDVFYPVILKMDVEDFRFTNYESVLDMFGIPNMTTNKDLYHNINNESKLFTSPYQRTFLESTYSNSKEIFLNNFSNKIDKSVYLNYNFSPNLDFREWISIATYQESNQDLIIGDERSIPLSSDAYLDYMMNNKASRNAGLLVPTISTIIGIGATALGGGAVGVPLILGGITSIGSNIARDNARMQDIKNKPDSLTQTKGNVLLELRRNEFDYYIRKETIDEANKQRIYNYFRLYGYKVNDFKVPDIRSRYWYNYIKTIGANIIPTGKIQFDAISKLKDIYDRGIFIHHIRDGMSKNEYLTTTKENMEMELI